MTEKRINKHIVGIVMVAMRCCNVVLWRKTNVLCYLFIQTIMLCCGNLWMVQT